MMKNLFVMFAIGWLCLGMIGCGKKPAPTEEEVKKVEKGVDDMMEQMKGAGGPPPAE
ncbi:MAG: hypothetical protein O3C40_17690 [Planctomycetota bacterium]|nr:hypothetical protein [Planctomycetota bacterium]